LGYEESLATVALKVATVAKGGSGTVILLLLSAASNCDFRHVAVLGMVMPGPTQPSIPLGSANEDQLWLVRQRQVWFIPFVDNA